ncbi:unnamed protein product [Paramecium pentaurelia]|uniref:Protein kinase domain-containing protein n=1 Tax=Paramecium pentaurelia TaxID=43138 RepID=A0A8S1V6B1_9CILI|nr:unnamed protein product [Paramecium pentaurelia]
MFQQNQFNQIDVGTIISAPSGQYTNRQFKLSKLLGQGSEGSVYEAIPINWCLNQNKVALKFSTFTKDYARQFYKQIIDYQNTYENYNSSNYQASNIIRIYDFFDYSFYLVLVMELGNIDLFKYMEQNKKILSIQQKQSICLQILQSIVFLHKQKLVHRDIKPENYLFIDQQVKLIDFGFIKFFNQDEIYMTKFVGTKFYQAPELIEGKSDYTMSVDVWAMAFVFYEIISGQKLLETINTHEIEKLILNHKLDQSSLFNKIERLMISNKWKQTIKSMLHPDPYQRITANDAQDLLKKSEIVQPSLQAQQNQFQQNLLQQNQGQQNLSLQNQGQQNQFQQNQGRQSLLQQNQGQQNQFQQNQGQQNLSLQHQGRFTQKQQNSVQSFQHYSSTKDQVNLLNETKNFIQILKNWININSLQQDKEQTMQIIFEFENLIAQVEKNLAQQMKQQYANQDYDAIQNKINENNELICEKLKIQKALENLEKSKKQLEQYKNLNYQLEELIKENQEVEKQIYYQDSLKKKISELTKKINEEKKNIDQNQISILENQIKIYETENLKQETQKQKYDKLQQEIQNLKNQIEKSNNEIIASKFDQLSSLYSNLQEEKQKLENKINYFLELPNQIQELQESIQQLTAKIYMGQNYQNELNSLKNEEQILKEQQIDIEQLKKQIEEKRKAIENLKIQQSIQQQQQQKNIKLDQELNKFKIYQNNKQQQLF